MNVTEAMQERVKGLFPDTLGVRFTDVSKERLSAEMDVRDDLCTVPGVMHGGAIMSLADTLGAVGTVLNLPPGATTTTLESKTNFLGAARTGSTISGECTPIHLGKQTMVWQTRVSSGDKTVAVVTQTQMVLAGDRKPEEVLTSLFSGKSIDEQKELLATLERAGAGLYRTFAAQETDEAVRAEMLACAEREEENAQRLQGA